MIEMRALCKRTGGIIFLNAITLIFGVLVGALLNVGVLYAGVQLFRRETILTR